MHLHTVRILETLRIMLRPKAALQYLPGEQCIIYYACSAEC